MKQETTKVGDYIKWEQVNGVKHEGEVIGIDSNIAIVKCKNHPEKKCLCDNIN